jgi:hypothetical protein
MPQGQRARALLLRRMLAVETESNEHPTQYFSAVSHSCFMRTLREAFLDETRHITLIINVLLEDQRSQSDMYQPVLASSSDQVSSVVEWPVTGLVHPFQHETVPNLPEQ